MCLLLLAYAGCKRAPDQGQPVRQTPKVSPRETVEQLIRLRDTGEYQQMEPLVIPERASDVIVTLVAVQEYLNANEQLCDLIRREVGLGLAASIDRSYRAYYLDIFSRYVDLLDERVADDAATVSFTIDGNLPALQARLRIVNGTWRYDPGAGDYPRLAEAFTRMARGLRQVMEDIESGRLPPASLREDPDRLEKEVQLRMRPGEKLLPPPPATAPGDGG